MPIYYLFLELAIKREGSGNSAEISADSLLQHIGRHHGKVYQKAKKAGKGKRFHVFKCRQQGGTPT